jgi:hypothetical protein
LANAARSGSISHGDDPPAGRQRPGHRQRRVAAVGADLEDQRRLHHHHQELEEPALDRAGEHLGRVELGVGLGEEPLQVGLGRRRVTLGVLVEAHAGGLPLPAWP